VFLYKHFVGGKDTSEVDDIIRNLGYILSSKRGCAYFLQSFGLTDTGFRTTGEMVQTITAEIEENVRLYEQRVELVEVDEEYSGGRAKLIVNLRVRGHKEKLKLTVDLADRKFDITPVVAEKKQA
jgi:phage baseplate assembly protein W